MSLKLKKGDFVVVITGKNKGKKGRIVKILKNKERVIVGNLNIVKKHQKSLASNKKGTIIYKEASLHISNVCYFCLQTSNFSKIGVKFNAQKKLRFLKKNNMLLKR